jgi:hypothetical protein
LPTRRPVIACAAAADTPSRPPVAGATRPRDHPLRFPCV